ncbi:hypothetical protein J2125_000229 [Erwinia toletana]|uniref:Uncharacterized protein n=1 Tax=Winslowiella toletana TaxID=92490 RepID=A0ABS4P301_9GAMM|nr:hypothetical protein [Winslowiella toletana]
MYFFWLLRVNRRSVRQGNVFTAIQFNGCYNQQVRQFVRNFSTFLLLFYSNENQTQLKLWQKMSVSPAMALPAVCYGIVYSLQIDIDFSFE